MKTGQSQAQQQYIQGFFKKKPVKDTHTHTHMGADMCSGPPEQRIDS